MNILRDLLLRFAYLFPGFTPGLISILLLGAIFTMLLITLDIFVRKKSGYSRFLDFILPILLLLIPPLLPVFLFFQHYSWSMVFSSFFLSHFLVSLPFILHWSPIRRWRKEEGRFLGFSEPYVFCEIALALSYLYIFFLALLILRYLRLDQDVSWNHCYENFSHYLLGLCALSFLLPQVYAIFLLGKDLRGLLSIYLENLAYSIHLFLLGHDLYFRLVFLVHKLYFSATELFFDPLGHRERNIPERMRAWIFLHFPLFLSILGLILLALEFFLRRGHIHYSFHFFFYAFLILQIFLLWRKIGNQDFSHTACLSDYAYGRWTKVRFPSLFWYYFPQAYSFYGFFRNLTSSDVSEILRQEKTWKLRSKVSFDGHRCGLYSRILRASGVKNSLGKSALFYKLRGVRFMHTGVSMPLHNCTALYASGFLDLLAVLHSPDGWHLHYRTILSLEKYKNFHYPSNLYVPSSASFSPEEGKSKFLPFQETNFLYHFSSLREKGVVIKTYTEELARKSYHLIQPRPDLFFDFSQSSFNEKGVLAYDAKASASCKVGSHKIFHSMSPREYGRCLLS